MSARAATAVGRGRKKHSGSAALAVLGNGWSGPLCGSSPPNGMKDGPDVILDPSVDTEMHVGSMWDGITRAASSRTHRPENQS